MYLFKYNSKKKESNFISFFVFSFWSFSLFEFSNSLSFFFKNKAFEVVELIQEITNSVLLFQFYFKW